MYNLNQIEQQIQELLTELDAIESLFNRVDRLEQAVTALCGPSPIKTTKKEVTPMFTFKEILQAVKDASSDTLGGKHQADCRTEDGRILSVYQLSYDAIDASKPAEVPQWVKDRQEELVILNTIVAECTNEAWDTCAYRLHSTIAFFDGMSVEIRVDHSKRYINEYRTTTKHGITNFAAKRNLFIALNEGCWSNHEVSRNQWYKFVSSKINDMTRGRLESKVKKSK